MSQNFSIRSFRAYKATFLRAIRAVLSEAPPRSLDEAAFPAYAHTNPVINWLFWQRLYTVMNVVAKDGPYQRVLDFGCGSGVLLPFLCEYSREVIGFDVDLSPYKRMANYISFPSRIHIHDSYQLLSEEYHPKPFDLIIALDVLEHVDNLPDTLDQLMCLLRPGGRLIISGPTENIFYQAGRRLAGREFSGIYHERGVAEIASLARQIGDVQVLAVLYPILPLFEIFSVEKLVFAASTGVAEAGTNPL